MKMFVFISLKKQVKMLVSISYLVSFGIYIHIQYFCGKWEINSKQSKYLLQLIKRRSEIQEKNMQCKCALHFEQWKTFPENYKLLSEETFNIVWYLVGKLNKTFL